MLKDLKLVKNKVGSLLDKYYETRDCDKLLWLAYMVNYHELRSLLGNESYAVFKNILMNKNTPSLESIRRVRQKFQEEGFYLGSKKTTKARRQEETIVREYLK